MNRDLLPASLYNGTTFDYDLTDSLYQSADYGLEIVLFTKTQRLLPSVTALPSGGWRVYLSAEATADMIAGLWGLQVYVTATDFRKHILSGVIEVLQDATAEITPATDSRSHSRIVLENIDSLMENLSFLKTLTPPDIESLEAVRRNYYFEAKREQEAEALRLGQGPKKNLTVRFAPKRG
jgi:hypothetical protein